jgi:hypothetical protein
MILHESGKKAIPWVLIFPFVKFEKPVLAREKATGLVQITHLLRKHWAEQQLVLRA